MPSFRIDMHWAGKKQRSQSKIVTARDVVDALEWADPGSWCEGDFDRCDIKIYRTETPAQESDLPTFRTD